MCDFCQELLTRLKDQIHQDVEQERSGAITRQPITDFGQRSPEEHAGMLAPTDLDPFEHRGSWLASRPRRTAAAAPLPQLA